MNLPNLKKRLLFAAWAIPLAWWMVNSTFSIMSLLPGGLAARHASLQEVIIHPGHILGLLIVFMACHEYLGMLSRLYPKNGFWMIYLWLGFQIVSYFVPDSVLTMRQATYILLIVVASESFLWGRRTGRWKRASLLFSGTVFLAIACVCMLDFYEEPFRNIFTPRFASPMLSQLGIVTVLASIFLCDTAAFFAGSMFGKHHFSSVSPKKTVEGGIAGLVAAVVTSTVGWHFFADPGCSIFFGLAMGIIIGVFAQLGDLLVSLMKRYFDVKDASNIIPGHGGILDRFDSLFFTAPVLNVFFLLVDKIFGLTT